MALVPDLRPSHLGIAFQLLQLPTCGIPSAIQIHGFRPRQYQRFSLALYRFVLHQLATAPLLLAGLSLNGYLPDGLDWFAVALLLFLVVGLFGAWVLLVEILRVVSADPLADAVILWEEAMTHSNAASSTISTTRSAVEPACPLPGHALPFGKHA